MAVAYVPAFLEDLQIFHLERANGLYGPSVFLLSNFLIGLPYLFLISLLFSLITYFLIAFNTSSAAKFWWYTFYLSLDLLAAESLVILISAIAPIFVAALAITAFANGLWMAVGGFLVPLPQLNVFWRYAWHYWDYQGWVFRGMMGNEFSGRSYACATAAAATTSGGALGGGGSGGGVCHCMFQSELSGQCRIAGEAVLRIYGIGQERRGMWVGIMIAIVIGYRLAGWGVIWWRRA
jgi:ABC-type multidrug transport system permease subunit